MAKRNKNNQSGFNARNYERVGCGRSSRFLRLAQSFRSRHCERSAAIQSRSSLRVFEKDAAIQSQKRTRQRSHLISPTHNKAFSPAFTIVELLVVIVVIAILAAITIVSYRSISSNARKSAMVSDLEQANKSLQVNKETSSSETFPSTLSSAGVTLSNNATYSYNVSADGSNYCLQGTVDGVTKSIAGNNQTVSNSTCVVATNLITNGDFSQGTSGWRADATGGFPTSNHIAYFTPTGLYGGIRVSSNCFSAISSHQYYISTQIKSLDTTANVAITQFDGGTNSGNRDQMFSVSNDGTLKRYSTILTANGTNPTSNAACFAVETYRASNWAEISTTAELVVDLTATFGPGKEPTAAQMDAILASLPNSWFNGQNVIQVPTS